MAAMHAQRNGATIFRTSPTPSKQRRGQIEKVGIEPYAHYSADEWIARLGKGARVRIRKK